MASRIQPPKGTRDFYPADMAVQNRIFDAWRRVSARYGFVEYEGPAFEHLELYTGKSGDEIVGQLYHFTDKGGRDLALRPEMTPTLARLAAQLGRDLKRPARWFSLPRLWRYEKQQRGRLREFFQLNMDILGADHVAADAELIAASCDICRELGLAESDVQARISSRRLLSALLDELGCANKESVYLALDRREKLPREEYLAGLHAAGLDDAGIGRLDALFSCRSVDELAPLANSDATRAAVAELSELFRLLDALGFSAWCRFDPTVVRGLAYYTGIVYELFDAGRSLRAIAGGGRYDNLLQRMGGEPMPAVGFGMGDVVIAELLRDRGLLASTVPGPEYWIIGLDDDAARIADAARQLRGQGRSVGYVFGKAKIGKQMQAASDAAARFAVFVGGDRVGPGEVEVKDLATGAQETRRLTDI